MARRTGVPARPTRCASPSSASATAPRRLVQGVEYYQDATRTRTSPGLMHVDLGGYHVGDIEFVAAFDVDADKVGKDLSQAIFAGQNNTVKFADVPNLGVTVQRGMTHDGIGKYLSKVIEKAPGSTADVVQVLQGHARGRAGQLPAGRQREGHQVVRRAGAGGRRRLRQLHPGVHRPRGRTGAAVRGAPACRSSATTSRARSARPSRTACWPACSATAACELERTYQLNVGGNTDFLQHARARAPGVQEDLQDERRHLAARVRPGRRERPRRPERLRAVADRPQVGAHPPRGPHLRRRAAATWSSSSRCGTRRTRRRRDRRGALRQARARPRHQRRARGPVGLLHEVAAGAAPRRRGARRVEAFIEAHRRPSVAVQSAPATPERAAASAPAKTAAKSKGKATPATKARARKA